MLFFQTLLLLGYIYAHWLTQQSNSRQRTIHLLLIASIVAILFIRAITWSSPLILPSSWQPSPEANAALLLLMLLSIAVGLPYFLLTTTSSLTQTWLHGLHKQPSPYWLYAISNAGSLLAILLYPFAIEPFFTIHTQTIIWTVGFVIYSLLNSVLLLASKSSTATIAARPLKKTIAAPTLKTYGLWLSLSALPSIMLLAFTNHLTQGISPIPFIWLLPLAVYLITYIITFNDRFRLRTRYLLLALGIIFIAIVFKLMHSSGLSFVQIHIAIFAITLFSTGIICHSVLYLRRPHPQYLTNFYLTTASGGVIGGIFVALLAPILFPDYWELHFSLMLAGILVFLLLRRRLKLNSSMFIRSLVSGPVSSILTIAAITVLLYDLFKTTDQAILTNRNFYGTLKVRENADTYYLLHGQILHGRQYKAPDRQFQPISYYSPQSGIGLALTQHPARPANQPMHVGVVGLGIGTVAAYCQPQDTYRFYEINPTVIDIAQQNFTFLQNCPQHSIILGDARLSLESELQQGSHQFDLLLLDAFSDDSIPAHLLTREAFQMYFQHLNPQGLLVANISNRYLNPIPLFKALSEEFQIPISIISSNPQPEAYLEGPTWVILTHNQQFLDQTAVKSASTDLSEYPLTAIWTDDYSNLFSILR